jgi:hypothetical protein
VKELPNEILKKYLGLEIGLIALNMLFYEITKNLLFNDSFYVEGTSFDIRISYMTLFIWLCNYVGYLALTFLLFSNSKKISSISHIKIIKSIFLIFPIIFFLSLSLLIRWLYFQKQYWTTFIEVGFWSLLFIYPILFFYCTKIFLVLDNETYDNLIRLDEEKNQRLQLIEEEKLRLEEEEDLIIENALLTEMDQQLNIINKSIKNFFNKFKIGNEMSWISVINTVKKSSEFDTGPFNEYYETNVNEKQLDLMIGKNLNDFIINSDDLEYIPSKDLIRRHKKKINIENELLGIEKWKNNRIGKVCLKCNKELDVYSLFCSFCGTIVTTCAICKLPLKSEQEIKTCSNCQNTFHLSHLLEIIKETGKCPVCNQIIN